MLYFTLFFFVVANTVSALCTPRSFGKFKFVCVCNQTYCDELELLTNISKDYSAVYETNEAGARFQSTTLPFSSKVDPGASVVQVNSSEMYQFILGFGGAFTDAAGINIKSLSIKLQEKVLLSYFSEKGLSYNMGRIPIASCDFSTYPYSYADIPGDFELKHFQLAKEDFLYKIPLIQKAASIKENLLLFGSPWSAPAWMKTNNAMNGTGMLKGNPGGKYYQTWANYFVRFLQEYKKNNITLWGITTQNEPTDGCLSDFAFQSMCFPPEKQKDFIKLHLGPSLQKAGFGVDNLKLMILDDDRLMLPKWVETILEDNEASQYVSGIAFHWYLGFISPYKLLNITHSKFPNVFFLASEACTGSNPWEYPKVDLGNWERAERYASDIIQDLLNWSVGWIDWNLALNMQGGPNWVKNFVDSPIIINAEAEEFYKQPMYYALAQFSKCLPRGSYRIGLKIPDSVMKLKNFHIAAFQTPKDKKVVIAVNRNEDNVNFALYDPAKGYLSITVSAHGIQSYVW